MSAITVENDVSYVFDKSGMNLLKSEQAAARHM